MNELTDDLDNNLLADDAYYGFTKMTATGIESSLKPRPQMMAQLQNGNGNLPSPPQVVEPIEENLGNDDGMTTMPVPNEPAEYIPPVEEGGFDDGGMMGGMTIGGSGGVPPMEEEVVVDESMMRTGDDKIFGMKPIVFYGLLAAVAAGGFWYFKKAKKA